MRLLIISHTPHHRGPAGIVGWGPTVREIDHLADLFQDVRHVAFLHPGPPPASALPYRSPRVELVPLDPSGGPGVGDKLGILRRFPAYRRTIAAELTRADAVHVRCPANLSLLSLGLLARRPDPGHRWIKYAGCWTPRPGEPWSYALQRQLLARDLPRALVTVNGRWPGQPAHVVSFLNPCLDAAELTRGAALAAAKRLEPPFRLLMVGALNEDKGTSRALRIAARLRARGLDVELELVGDGPERARYESLADELGLRAHARFLGWRPRSDLGEHYGRAHLLLLPSLSEGWPKVLSEGMAYGAVPLAGSVSSIPQVLRATRAGLCCDPRDVEGMATRAEALLRDPPRWETLRDRGPLAAPRFGFAAYTARLRELLGQRWGLSPTTGAA